MTSENPYRDEQSAESPQQENAAQPAPAAEPPPIPPAGPTNLSFDGQFLACPFCGGQDIQKLSYTWWGGMLGPKLCTHVKCRSCKKTYNGKSGRSNLRFILTYQIIAVVVVLGIVLAGWLLTESM